MWQGRTGAHYIIQGLGVEGSRVQEEYGQTPSCTARQCRAAPVAATGSSLLEVQEAQPKAPKTYPYPCPYPPPPVNG